MHVDDLCRELRRSGTPPHALALLARYGKERGGDAREAIGQLAQHVDTAPAGTPRRHRLPRVTRGTMVKAEAVLALGRWPDDTPAGPEAQPRPVELQELPDMVRSLERGAKKRQAERSPFLDETATPVREDQIEYPEQAIVSNPVTPSGERVSGRAPRQYGEGEDKPGPIEEARARRVEAGRRGHAPPAPEETERVPGTAPGIVEVRYEEWTLEDLHGEATARNLQGRSGMDKAALVKALRADDREKEADQARAESKRLDDAAQAMADAGKGAPEPGEADYDEWTKEELHDEAAKRNLPGRGGLNKGELVKLLRKDDKARAGDEDEE